MNNRENTSSDFKRLFGQRDLDLKIKKDESLQRDALLRCIYNTLIIIPFPQFFKQMQIQTAIFESLFDRDKTDLPVKKEYRGRVHCFLERIMENCTLAKLFYLAFCERLQTTENTLLELQKIDYHIYSIPGIYNRYCDIAKILYWKKKPGQYYDSMYEGDCAAFLTSEELDKLKPFFYLTKNITCKMNDESGWIKPHDQSTVNSNDDNDDDDFDRSQSEEVTPNQSKRIFFHPILFFCQSIKNTFFKIIKIACYRKKIIILLGLSITFFYYQNNFFIFYNF